MPKFADIWIANLVIVKEDSFWNLTKFFKELNGVIYITAVRVYNSAFRNGKNSNASIMEAKWKKIVHWFEIYERKILHFSCCKMVI